MERVPTGVDDTPTWAPPVAASLFVVLVVLGAFPVSSLWGWTMERYLRNTERAFDQSASALASGMAEASARLLEDRRRMLLGVRAAIPSDAATEAELAAVLTDQHAATATFSGLELWGSDGRLVATADGAAPLPRAAVQDLHTEPDTKTARVVVSAVSPVVAGSGSTDDMVVYALPVTIPATSEDGFLAGGVALSGLARQVQAAAAAGQLRVVVVDSAGQVAVDSLEQLGPNSPAELQHGFSALCPPITASVLDERGRTLRTACAQFPINASLWSVWVSATADQMATRSARFQRISQVALGANLLLLCLISLAVSLRIRTHLGQLVRVVRQLGSGSLDPDLGSSGPYTPREVRELRQEARRMVAHWKASDARTKELVQELEQANRRLRPLAEAWAHIGEAVEILDADGHILFANPACVEALGSEATEKGRPSSVLAGDEGVRIADAVARQKSWTGEVHVEGPHGRRVHAVTVSPVISDGTLERMVVIRWDLTDQRTAESVAAATERMASVGTVAAGMAHEINNPLTYIQVNLKVLQAAQATQSDPELHRAVEESLEGVGQIHRRVKDLLLLSRHRPMSGIGESRQVVPVRQIVDSAVNLAKARLQGVADVSVRIDGDPMLRVRVSEATQVLVNLLINAGLATAPGGPRGQVEVEARSEGKGAKETVVIDVRDHGVGMSAEALQHAFVPFHTTREVGQGLGLGLPVARGLVESHGGTLSAQSTPGHGSVFTVRLPASDQQPATRQLPRPKQRLRVLLVDDDKLVVESIARMLSAHDCTVAIGGFEGLDRLEEQSFDAVLSDVMMPDIDGPSLFEELSMRWPELVPRFAFVTGAPRGSAVARAVESTGRRVFHKPVQAGMLDSWLQKLDPLDDSDRG